MYDISLIKSRISCIDYAQQLGLSISKDGDRCKSPLRDSANNSSAFVVHRDYWFDFVENKGGDVIDLSALVNYNGDRGLAIYELAKLAGVADDDEIIDWKQIAQKRVSTIATWHSNLRPQDREYLHSRRITDETINRLRIGFTGNGVECVVKGEKQFNFAANRISIPAYKNEYVVSWVARATSDSQMPKYLKPPTDDCTEYEPFGLHTLNRTTETLYIAEGAFDYLCIEQSGYAVLATMGGYFGKETLRSVLSIAKNYKRVALTFDNDSAGRTFTAKFGEILFSHRIAFDVAEIPYRYKDLADYYKGGNDIKDLKMQDGIVFLAKTKETKEEFKDFCCKAARLIDRADMAELFSIIEKAEQFPSAWLKEVAQSCYKAPPEPIIVEEILKKHQLTYIPSIGFYEYLPKGKWELLFDEVVHGYISDELGVFTAGGKLEPIKKLMRPEILSMHEFDRKPVVNFINGTLELDTGNFREHSADDYCSIQLPYAYNAKAKCPRFEKFIEEITAEDTKRAENLQFIAGYALLSDCRYERMFVLTGEGGNGKTIYVKVLERLFGEENITHFDPVGLTADFKLIHLRSSWLNITGEIKCDLTSTEENLKAIASGESLQACLKGKDYLTFRSRTKLIFCTNGQLRSSDTSDGLARRLTIIDFPCQFVDFPDKDDPLQKQKDVGLFGKLLDELPGIFNWAYQGYKDLLFYNGFTETSEHAQLMDNFRKASNPVECFLEDLLDGVSRKEYIRAEMYDDYVRWCEINGHKPLASTRFHPAFTTCSKRCFEPFEQSERQGNGSPRKRRGYRLIAK